jgi:hypothetical protein
VHGLGNFFDHAAIDRAIDFLLGAPGQELRLARRDRIYRDHRCPLIHPKIGINCADVKSERDAGVGYDPLMLPEHRYP